MIDLIKVGAHYAVSSVFEDYGVETEIFSYRAFREDFMILRSGQMSLSVGRIFIRSSITRKADRISFCTLYFGGQALNCGVRSFLGEDAYLTMKQEVVTAFNEADFAAIIRLMDTHFGMHNYTLKALFRDEQRHILHLIIAGTLQEFEDKFTSLYENSRSLMGFLRETGMPVPHRFMTTAETALNLQLQQMFTSETVELERIREVVSEINDWNVSVDTVALEFIIRRRLEEAMAALLEEPKDDLRLSKIIHLSESITALPVGVNLWKVQNMYWDMLHTCTSDVRPGIEEPAGSGTRIEAVSTLGKLLYFNVEAALAARGIV
jgi:hypothetical protein